MNQKILIICTGNTCRSQMAEGFLKSFDPQLQVYSAGTKAEQHVNAFAVKVMAEVGIDISRQKPKSVDLFLNDSFDYVITVCDGAKESCPYFSGKVGQRLHIGFEDPASATGSDEEKLLVYRKVRDQIKEHFYKFYKSKLNGKSN
jgi:arsenate reductase (thioredoxin)